MSRRFIPPAVDALGDGPLADAALALVAARESAYVEGRDEGWRQGHAAGVRDGEARAQEVCQTELAAVRADFARRDSGLRVAEAMQHLLSARDEDQRALETTMRTAIIAALRALFPTLLDLAAGRDIAALLADTLAERPTDTLMLQAHPETIAAVEAEGVPPESATRLTMIADPAAAPGTATLGWAGGGMTYDPAMLLEQITKILGPCPATSETIPT